MQDHGPRVDILPYTRMTAIGAIGYVFIFSSICFLGITKNYTLVIMCLTIGIACVLYFNLVEKRTWRKD